jgi:GAF domain-containing protein
LQSIIRRKSGNGVTEYILRSRQPLLVKGNMAEVAQKLGFTLIGVEATAWMGVPMVVGDRAVGVIAMQSFQGRHTYDEHDLDLFTAVASSAAISLEGIRLLQQVQSRARQEQILREVTARVHTAIDAEAIMRTAAQEINRRLGLETFVYLDSDQEAETATAHGGNGPGSNIE